MNKETVKQFIGGMNKDLEKGNIPKDAYLEARNFRIVTTEGLSSGAFENIQGTNVAHDSYDLDDDFIFDGANCFPDGHYVCGSVRIRDTFVLFVTDNTGLTPNGGRSIIYKFTVDTTTEKINTLEVVYDDSLNNSTGTLNFSRDNRIKAVARYETPEIQKVYWTDGYNRIRFIDIAKYNTTDGLVKSGSNYYMSPDLLEFIPSIDLNKPYLNDMITGTLKPGVVQYAYQYFRLNGSETIFSPLSDVIHIASSSDTLSQSLNYIGEENPDVISGKGCDIKIDLDNSDKYNKLRIIRLHYPYLNAMPTISVIGELDINSTMTDILFKDTGNNLLTQLTIDEFNINNTELFKCEDIEAKDNQLFVANITKDDLFTVDDWDARAIRFKRIETPGPGGTDDTDEDISLYYNGSDINFVYNSDSSFDVTITNVSNWFPLPSYRILVDITDIYSLVSSGTAIVSGEYDDIVPNPYSYSSTQAQTTFSNIIYDSGTDTLTFTVTTSGSYFTNFQSFISGELEFLRFEYDYDDFTYTLSSYLDDTTNPITVTEPADLDDPVEWDNAGWDDYTEKHDGINEYNDTDNDFDPSFKYVYQGNGTTLGAEGPNIKIGFTTESLLIDESNQTTTFWVGSENTATNKSYKSFASPFKSGKRSWQRDETYRLYIVFYDDRGRMSVPKWICDLRMPSLHETGDYCKLAYLSSGSVYTNTLYPVVTIKSMPAGVSSAQIFRVQRTGNDRTVLTQGLVVPSTNARVPANINTVIASSRLVHKLISPEVNITKNISHRANDYLEFVTNYTGVVNNSNTDYYYYKVRTTNNRPKTANERTTLRATKYINPSKEVTYIDNSDYTNFNTTRYGSSGLIFYHENSYWTVDGITYCLVNYKRNIFDSQYGGNTYNKRIGNVSIPCSDIITTTGTNHTCYNGDTFINYFSVSNFLFDLTRNTASSYNETIFFPVESSINLELQHGFSMHRDYTGGAQLAQEIAGDWTNNSSLNFKQAKSMYQYNTVYSQDSTARYAINISLENEAPTKYDCLIKASKTKLNGETSDSWSKFPINEYIEVDSQYGEVRALSKLNEKMIFFQENSIGLLSINERSLIQDNLTSKLTLGTGGVLERFDYLSNSIGINNKSSIVKSQIGIYWYYDKDTSLYRFIEGPENISKVKNMWSWFKTNHSSNYIIHGVYDSKYNDVIYTLINQSTNTGYTISFGEQIDKFVSFYDFVPSHYISGNNIYLSSKYDSTGTREYLHFHNSVFKPRCMFYSFTMPGDADDDLVYDSEVHLLFNDDYLYTKVFDNIFYISNAYNSNNIEIYNDTFTSLRAYTDYQNTHYISLVYGVGTDNLQRRERGWTTIVPRNAVSAIYTSSPDIFDPANLAGTEWGQRMRDKFLILEMIYDNNTGNKFIVPFIGMKYRVSYR